ncbi:MAG: head GIN domain-containing protein [Flavobacteriaceae bacterium]
MKTITTLVLGLFSIVTFSQNIEKHTADFSDLKTFDGISVKLIQSDENKAVISGKYADDVMLVNKNGLLKIRLRTQRSFNGYDTYVTLYYKTLHLIDANEGSYISSDEQINAVDVEVKAQEGSEIELNIAAKRLNVRSVSGSEVTINGVVDHQDVVVNSGGKYNAKGCKTLQAEVNVSAGGSAKVYATDVAKATVKAGGNIRIYGNPKIADTKEVLGGNITVVK